MKGGVQARDRKGKGGVQGGKLVRKLDACTQEKEKELIIICFS